MANVRTWLENLKEHHGEIEKVQVGGSAPLTFEQAVKTLDFEFDENKAIENRTPITAWLKSGVFFTYGVTSTATLHPRLSTER